MNMKVHVDIVSVEREIFSGLAQHVSVSGISGDLDIYYGHAPLLTTLKPGHIVVYVNGQENVFYVSGGILEVQPNNITVLADIVLRAENLNEDDAMKAKEDAQKKLNSVINVNSYKKASEEIAKASAQLRLISKLRK